MNKIDNKILKEDYKKTDYPDLEKLPNHNNLRHLVYVLLNKPIWFVENLYEKYFLKDKIELEETKLKLQQKELELNILKIQLEELKLNRLAKN
tara:strand:+ start:161 stop:439 length:279 start_codon:yes stop_codon:yes gene_type:complete